MKFLALAFIALINFQVVSAQTFFGSQPLAHTYSIVARDPQTGEIGVAVQSHWFSVGTIVSWGKAGVGVVATQSLVNASLGPRGLALLENGLTPQQALDGMLANDEGNAYRQVAILDAKGNLAVHTGEKCIPEAGHVFGENYAIQANLMVNDQVWVAMEEAFLNTKGPLAERMVAALEAGQQAGGDIRGKQSAALLVVRGISTGKVWEDRLIDLQIADHPTPIRELRRLLKLQRAYNHMNQGDLAIERGETSRALFEYANAESMFPNNLEMKFWHAVSLVNIGETKKALPIFQQVFAQDNNWRILLPKLKPIGLIEADQEIMDLILTQ